MSESWAEPDMRGRIEEIRKFEQRFRGDCSTGDPKMNLSHLRAANALNGALNIIAELESKIAEFIHNEGVSDAG